MIAKLEPGVWIACAFNTLAEKGEPVTIEQMRACMESAPTFPSLWDCQNGADYVRTWLAK